MKVIQLSQLNQNQHIATITNDIISLPHIVFQTTILTNPSPTISITKYPHNTTTITHIAFKILQSKPFTKTQYLTKNKKLKMKKFFVIYSLKQKLSPTLYKTKKTVTKHTTVNKSLKFEEFETQEQAKTFIEQIQGETKLKDSPFLSESEINNILRSIVKENRTEMKVYKNTQKIVVRKIQKESNLVRSENQVTSLWTILPNGHAKRHQKQEQKYDGSYSALQSQQKLSNSSTNPPQQQPQSTIVTQQHTSQAHTQESMFSSSSSSSSALASNSKLSYWVVWNKNDLSLIQMGKRLVQLGKMLFQLEKENSTEWMKDNIMTRKYRTRREAAEWMEELKRERMLKLNRLKGEMIRVKVSVDDGIRKEDRSDVKGKVQVSQMQRQKQEVQSLHDQLSQLAKKQQQSKFTPIQQIDQQQQQDILQQTLSQPLILKRTQPLIVLNYEDIQPLQITQNKKQTKIDIKETTEKPLKQKGINNARYEKLRWPKRLIDEIVEVGEGKIQSVGVIVQQKAKQYQMTVIETKSGIVKEEEKVIEVVEEQVLLNKVYSQPQQNQPTSTITQHSTTISQSLQKGFTLKQQTPALNIQNIKITEQPIKEAEQLPINVTPVIDTQHLYQEKIDSVKYKDKEVIKQIVVDEKLQLAEQKYIKVEEDKSKGAQEQNIVKQTPHSIKEHPQVIVQIQPITIPIYTHPFNKSYIRRLISSRVNIPPTPPTQNNSHQQEEYVIYPKLSIKQSPGFSIGSYQIKNSKTQQVIKSQIINLGQTKRQEGYLLALAFSLSVAQHFSNNNKRIKIHLNTEMNHALHYQYKLDRQLIQTRQFAQQIESRVNRRVQYVV